MDDGVTPQQRVRRRGMVATLSVLGLASTILAGCAQAPVSNAGVFGAPSCDKPVYPQQALANRIEGTTTIGYLVGPEGAVTASKLIASSGNASLDAAVLDAIAKCRFAPRSHNGKPVGSYSAVQYVWKLH